MALVTVLSMANLCTCGCGSLLQGRQRSWASEKCRKIGTRAAWILKTYGITMEEWNRIWEHQGRVCAICKRPPRQGEVFHIDHEHQENGAGPLRGIVCPYDNTRIIVRLKSHYRAQALADYLLSYPATEALGREVWSPGRPKKKRQPRKRKR